MKKSVDGRLTKTASSLQQCFTGERKNKISQIMELNGYRIMWLFVFFDLPTETPKDRKNASGFRNNLTKRWI